MVAAFLPLPVKPVSSMVEQPMKNESKCHVDLTSEPPLDFRTSEETRYRSARWWRNLNRVMSVVGLLIIGAIIALIVIGVREQWAS
jgi:hypothetical protein